MGVRAWGNWLRVCEYETPLNVEALVIKIQLWAGARFRESGSEITTRRKAQAVRETVHKTLKPETPQAQNLKPSGTKQ